MSRADEKLLEAIYGKPAPEDLAFSIAQREAIELAEATERVVDLRGRLLRFVRSNKDLLPVGKAREKAHSGYLKDLTNNGIQKAVDDIVAEKFSGRKKV